KNGTPIVLRPIKPEDELLLDELFQSFSEETMRFRFFQVIKEMPHETLTRYCNIDYDREIAIVAEVAEDNDRKISGVARLILQPGRKHGEFAVVVGDQWQGLGLGSKLVELVIALGREMGLDTIYGDVLSNNHKMLHLCASRDFKMDVIDDEMTKATLDLKA
ncbi:MAG: GNAT family N-acetyltransferase, partial [Candidatus Bathyarchaeota archaeon]